MSAAKFVRAICFAIAPPIVSYCLRQREHSQDQNGELNAPVTRLELVSRAFIKETARKIAVHM